MNRDNDIMVQHMTTQTHVDRLYQLHPLLKQLTYPGVERGLLEG